VEYKVSLHLLPF